MVKTYKKSKTKSTAPILLKLNLGAGSRRVDEHFRPLDGFTHVDKCKKTNSDVIHDLNKYPWPWKDESVDEIFCCHFLEHLDGIERIPFFNECYRIMKPDATMKIITPAPFTHRYMQDPTHKFPMVVQEFYSYLHKGNRESMRVSHYPLTCNFDWQGTFQTNPELMNGRTQEFCDFHARYSINSLADLVVILTRK